MQVIPKKQEWIKAKLDAELKRFCKRKFYVFYEKSSFSSKMDVFLKKVFICFTQIELSVTNPPGAKMT